MPTGNYNNNRYERRREGGIVTTLIGSVMNRGNSNSYANENRGFSDRSQIDFFGQRVSKDSERYRCHGGRRNHGGCRDEETYRDQVYYQSDYDDSDCCGKHASHANYANYGNHSNNRGLRNHGCRGRRRGHDSLVGTILVAGKQLIDERSQRKANERKLNSSHVSSARESPYETGSDYSNDSHLENEKFCQFQGQQVQGEYEGLNSFETDSEYGDSNSQYRSSFHAKTEYSIDKKY